ncbi:unnamed protein product, partial [Ectocarpus sp. 13 AM-2016]
LLLWFLGGDLSVLADTRTTRGRTLACDRNRQRVRVIEAHLFVSLVV